MNDLSPVNIPTGGSGISYPTTHPSFFEMLAP
jgi:hypothetical protein